MDTMDNINLVESFAEFKEFKNIDRETLMRILEDVFRHMLIKKYGSDENFDIIVNIDRGDLEVWRNRIIVEDCLTGQEVTVMAFTDGKTILPMLPSQDHKAIFDGDLGPNTGGMGAYCPTPIVNEQVMQTIREQILEPAVYGLEREGRRYRGILYAGVMITPVGPKVIEFNCRFGDPETQAVLPLLKSDLADIFIAIIDGNLNLVEPVWKEGAAVCVVMTSRGYPGRPEVGKKITGIRTYRENHAYLFHAGTRKEGANWVTAGGRVLGVTAVHQDIRTAVKAAYDTIENIHFEGAHCRRDIAYQAFK